MRVLIIGAPDTGKRKIAAGVRDKLPDLELQLEPDHSHPEAALGVMSDYRVELSLALERMWFAQKDHTVSTHSLVDSVVYSFNKIENGAEYMTGDEIDRWLLTVPLIGSLLADSFKYDHIFFLPGSTEDTAYIEETLQDVLTDFGLSYIELGSDVQENIKVIVETVGTRRDIPES